jgi:hypothetical protein
MKRARTYIIALAILGIILISSRVSAAELKRINTGSKLKRIVKVGDVNYFTNYPFLPVIENNFTTITIADTIRAIKAKNLDGNLSRSMFAVILAEAAKTSDRKSFKGINNNYAGVQTDSGLWGNSNFEAQTAKIDSGGVPRMFAVFTDFNSFLDFLADRLAYKGFSRTATADTWANNYIRNWWGVTPTPNLIKSKGAIFTSAIAAYNK